VSVIVGRNVQADSLFVCFILAFLYFYLKAKSNNKLHNYLIAGFMLGMAIFSKQPAVLIVAVIILWELIANRNLRFLNRHFVTMIAVTVAVLLPFYGFHLIAHAGELIDAQRSGSLRLSELPNVSRFLYLLRETWWGFSPPVALIAVASFIYFIRRASRADLLIYIAIVIYGLFFIFLHKHSYYMLPIAPFAALMGARLWQGGNFKAVLLAVVCGATILISIFLLCGMKYGWDSFKIFGQTLEKAKIERVTILTDGRLLGNYGPILAYYAPKAEIANITNMKAGKDGIVPLNYRNGLVILLDYKFPENLKFTIGMDVVGPELFGYVFYRYKKDGLASPHEFSSGEIAIVKKAPFYKFGIKKIAHISTIKFAYLPPGYLIKYERGAFRFVRK